MGRVLGITTGSVVGGAYLALKYQEFKFDADGEHNGGEKPYTFFYELNQLSFAYSTMEDYFNVTLKQTSSTATSASFEINVRLKSAYAFKRIMLTSEAAKLSVDVLVKYNYYDENGDIVETQTLVEPVYLDFDSVEELKSGKTVIFKSEYTPNGDMKEYASSDIIFDWDFGRIQQGSMDIYSRIEK